MFKAVFKSIAIITIASIIGALWYASPIFKPFPKPTGPYSVGTTVLEFADPSRKEIYSENPNDKRTLVVRFFYPYFAPNGASKGKPADNLEKYPYLGDKMPYFKQHLSNQYYLTHATSKLLLCNIQTHSGIDAPISEEQNSYPVVLFSHGLLGYPSDTFVTILENLATHGYIVAAIDHPYFNGLTLYANGKIVTEKKLSNQFNIMSQVEQKKFLTQAIEIYKADMKFTVDELARLNQDPKGMFYNRINLEQIAVMGHSAGGTASIEFCRTDKRCKAAINLDGWYDHVIGQEPINKPLLLVFAEKSIEVAEPTPDYLKRKELTREQYYEREKTIKEHKERLCSVPTCSMVIIPGADHGDFDDMMFLKWPFREWNAVEPYKTMALINGNILNFLNQYLT